MARRKGSTGVDPRPTLEEIKKQDGRYLFVDFRGVKGPRILPAHRPRFQGDITTELCIIPFHPQQISDDWLDDPTFSSVYQQDYAIKVWRSDTIPQSVDLESDFPVELSGKLNQYAKALAYLVAMSEFDDKMKDVINVKDKQSGDNESVRFDKTEVLPFLKAVQYYEKRLMNRPEVMRFIAKRLQEIIDAKSPLETAESF